MVQPLTAGVDEVGRGPLAGPVVAGAVILNVGKRIDGLADSKLLSTKRRESLAVQIMTNALDWSVAWADAAEIDSINILQATYLAMRRAVLGLRIQPDRIDVDGNSLPDLTFGDRQVEGKAIVGGDRHVASISAASIIAKVHRDNMMKRMDVIYPSYGFCRHKGYATAEHRATIDKYGPCPQHRRTFRPVSSL